jgi:hypothetical protein
MPAHDLHRILVASHHAGLQRFIFHPDLNPGAAEWNVISRLCGKKWKEDPNGYWPSDCAYRKYRARPDRLLRQSRVRNAAARWTGGFGSKLIILMPDVF